MSQMYRHFKLLIAAAVLLIAGAFAPASAGTIGFTNYQTQNGLGDGLISPSLLAGVYTMGHTFGSWHTFEDKVFFTVSAATGLTFKLLTWGNISLDNISFTNLDNPSSLPGDGPGSYKTGTIAGHTGMVITELLSLSSGHWVLTIAGSACHCAGYAIQLAQAAVTPIPGALLMFLTALGGLGGFAWRRKSAGAAA